MYATQNHPLLVALLSAFALILVAELPATANADHQVCTWKGPGNNPGSNGYDFYCTADIHDDEGQECRYLCHFDDHDAYIADFGRIGPGLLEFRTPCNGGKFGSKKDCKHKAWGICIGEKPPYEQCYYMSRWDDCEWPTPIDSKNKPKYLGIWRSQQTLDEDEDEDEERSAFEEYFVNATTSSHHFYRSVNKAEEVKKVVSEARDAADEGHASRATNVFVAKARSLWPKSFAPRQVKDAINEAKSTVPTIDGPETRALDANEVGDGIDHLAQRSLAIKDVHAVGAARSDEERGEGDAAGRGQVESL